jgi:four helix bundle protein
MREIMNYHDWLKSLPKEIPDDLLWKIEAYRLALFLSELAWHDATKLAQDRRTLGLSDQLYRAVGSISANISEGYSRSGGKDRARFYEYALGSARESLGWFYKGRHVLGENVSEHRIRFTTQIVRLLLTMIPDQRSVTLHEQTAAYFTSEQSANPDELAVLIKEVPFPDITHHASRITVHAP